MTGTRSTTDTPVIEPLRADWVDALAAGDDEFTARFGRPVLAGWAGFPEVLPHLVTEAHADVDRGWGSHLIFEEGPGGALIGLGGWKGPPDAMGVAELGYAVAPAAQGRGVASRFVEHVIQSGRHAGVSTVVAHTLPRESASTSVLRRCGFRHVGSATDPVAGDVWRWEQWVTGRLTIEPREVAHASGLVAALDDERVGRYIGGPDVTTVDALVERIEYVNGARTSEWGETWLNWVARLDVEHGRPVIGRIEATVHHRTPVTAEFAYLFGPAWWGHGYATEATAWMLARLRDEHGVVTAYATVDPANAASIELLERLGFVRCALPDEEIGSYDAGDLVFRSALR